jgi:molybdenum cofactor biosynthesis protein B
VGVDEHRSYAPESLGYGLVTVSDTRALAEDESGDALVQLVEEASQRVIERRLVRDELALVREQVVALTGHDEVDVIVLTGGTGFSPRDLTVEAVAPLFQRPVEGFGELFRMLSFEEVGAAAMLSRATAGIVNRRLVFLLPGSLAAVRLAMTRLILPEAPHLLGQVRRPAG